MADLPDLALLGTTGALYPLIAGVRESMLKNVRLHREIMEAWEEHGGETEREGHE